MIIKSIIILQAFILLTGFFIDFYGFLLVYLGAYAFLLVYSVILEDYLPLDDLADFRTIPPSQNLYSGHCR